jgi:nucleoside 2-deoxyribosyltransferase
MKIYIICPVRNATPQQVKMFNDYVRKLEKNHTVFLPHRDAPQKSETGYEIVESELNFIKSCDRVDVFWDIESKGSHFDLGMCYALRKPIKWCYDFHKDPKCKSYKKVIAMRQRMVEEVI